MNYAENEIAIVEKAIANAVDTQMRELADLQLAVVGGGGGEVIFF